MYPIAFGLPATVPSAFRNDFPATTYESGMFAKVENCIV